MTGGEPLRVRERLRALAHSEYLTLVVTGAYFLLVLPFAPAMASSRNLADLVSNVLPFLIVAIGETYVLLTAGIDLSVTATIALASVVGALVMSASDGVLGGRVWAVPCALVAMLAVGAAVGWLNGVAVARLRMPPFLVTLSSTLFFSGLAVWLSQSRGIGNLPAAFIRLGTGTLLGVPIDLLVAGGVTGLAHFHLGNTVSGRWIRAVGHNPRTAACSGVPVRRTLVRVYVLAGVLAALASVLYTARLETGSPVLGERILLDVIGAVVIGGTSLFGGRGKVVGTLQGVLFMTVLGNSLVMLNLSHFTILMAKGAVILIAALIDAARNRALGRA